MFHFSSVKNLKHFIFICIHNCASNKDKHLSTPYAAFQGHFLARKLQAGAGSESVWYEFTGGELRVCLPYQGILTGRRFWKHGLGVAWNAPWCLSSRQQGSSRRQSRSTIAGNNPFLLHVAVQSTSDWCGRTRDVGEPDSRLRFIISSGGAHIFSPG